MHMPSSALRRKITFWQSQGILREEPTDTFILIEEQKGKHADIVVMEDEGMESAMASSQDQREEELQVRAKNCLFLITLLPKIFLHIFASKELLLLLSPSRGTERIIIKL